MNKKLDVFFTLLLTLIFCMLMLIFYNFQNFTQLDFILFGAAFFIMLLSYFNGIVIGLLSSIFIIFIYSSYVLYGNLSSNKSVSFFTYLWIIVIPLIAVTTGNVSKNINSIQSTNETLQKEIKNLITIDETTGLNNLKSFYIDLDKEISKSKRYNSPFTLMAVKLKYYQEILNILGENKFANLIKNISININSSTRNEDERYKISLDLFFILMPNTDITGAETVKNRIREKLENLNFNLSDKTLNLEVKIAALQYDKTIENAFQFKELIEKELEYDV